MKKFTHHYGADLEWVQSFASKLKGRVQGNFIVLPETISNGERYFLECEKGVVALYSDAIYQIDTEFIQENISDDFLSIYYTLTEGEAKVTGNKFSYSIGRWYFNMVVVDSKTKAKFQAMAGSKVFVLCIFIKKDIIESLYNKNQKFSQNPNKCKNYNQIKMQEMQMYRMNNKSFHAITDLRKIKAGGILFDLNLMGTVNLLINEYLTILNEEREVLHLVNKKDLSEIMLSQRYLMENIDIPFPGNKLIANKANMSESKYINLFKKVTSDTPCNFFICNKLIRSKELLQENTLSIAQVATQINLTNSYFSSKFKSYFGISPKTYTKQLQRYDRD